MVVAAGRKSHSAFVSVRILLITTESEQKLVENHLPRVKMFLHHHHDDFKVLVLLLFSVALVQREQYEYWW